MDSSGTTTGTRDVVRLPGRATEIPHKGDPDSGVAIIAEIGRETMDSAEDAANDSTKTVARVVSTTRATFCFWGKASYGLRNFAWAIRRTFRGA